MRQPVLVTAALAAAALSLTACGSGDKAAASAPSTVKATSSTASPTASTTAPTQAAPVTVTQQPASTVTRTVAPAPTVTETHVATVQAPAADSDSGSGAGDVGGCSYNGVSIVTNHLSCAFAQNVVAAHLNGSSTAYSPATGRSYTFSCDDGYVTRCSSDGTSSSIQNGGYLLW